MAWNTATPERRYGVYRNNVTASLTAALASSFPATKNNVGPDFFQAMARAFVAAHPPSSPVLLAYGDEFPDFVAALAPARDLVYLPGVMRLEIARGRAYHAADVSPLAPAALAAIDPARLGAVLFRRLAEGATLADAAETAMHGHADFDLSQNLAVLLRSGAFAAISKDNSDENPNHA